MYLLALSDSYEYPLVWVYAIKNILILIRLLTSESDVYGRQILTSKVDPRAVRIIFFYNTIVGN